MAEHTNRLHLLCAFASLRWYEETIKFVFTFVAKTSELLLATGIVISTANFLTDGAVMSHNIALSDAWSWAQALAIDSSLGIVFMNALQSLRERDSVKAVIFFTLTALLATVAGLITHFDALGHATGLSVTDARVSGIISVWVMTALRAVAVIGFLLASRLKEISFVNNCSRSGVRRRCRARNNTGSRWQSPRSTIRLLLQLWWGSDAAGRRGGEREHRRGKDHVTAFTGRRRRGDDAGRTS